MLKGGGADVIVTGSNPFLHKMMLPQVLLIWVLLYMLGTIAQMKNILMFLNKALDHKPHIIIDDGGDLVNLLHTARPRC